MCYAREGVNMDNEALNEHLKYELWMFFSLCDELIKPDERDLIINNALIESCCIHLRNLIDFLQIKGKMKKRNKEKPDDILARDFFDQPDEWDKLLNDYFAQNENAREKLQEARIRANKEITHLTEKRYAGQRPEKVWDFKSYAELLKGPLNLFANNASPQKLPSEVIDYLKNIKIVQ